MTIVIGLDYFDETVIISDTRVSWGTQLYLNSHGIEKTIPLIMKDGKLVMISYAGPLRGALQVITALQNRTANYGRRLVLEEFKTNIQQWISEALVSIDPQFSKELSFLITGLENARLRHLVDKNGKLLREFGLPESHIWAYRVTPSRKVILDKPSKYKRMVTMIGSGKKKVERLEQHARDIMGAFRGNQGADSSPIMRAYAATVLLSGMLEDDKRQDLALRMSVGGVYQFYRIAFPQEETRPYYFWPNSSEHLVVTPYSNLTRIQKATSGEEYFIMPLTESSVVQIENVGKQIQGRVLRG